MSRVRMPEAYNLESGAALFLHMMAVLVGGYGIGRRSCQEFPLNL